MHGQNHIKGHSLFAGNWYVELLLIPHCCTFLSAHFSPGQYLHLHIHLYST